ncbi:hypothetical protein KL911_000820 [Ogataea haglerorum]|uniref:uncharacterized protein n=1 Tax=Ogataea haglerorum TaxID=1937702 RepID=UPI001C895D2C|nr:uncharacterized protein KL911_000820 [Ogataea haglerorum]KAG7750412.1 hypothetical protein KL912_000972 [Ogataea haglerorum]KAG7757844.1 hypothetical protein KL911_000820 [Ogataea haglerorum]
MLTFESSQIQGARNIIEKLTSLGFNKVAHRISTLDAQPASENGDVLVMVTGELLIDDEQNTQRYSQVFHLIPDAGSYYVLNDIFRLNYAPNRDTDVPKIPTSRPRRLESPDLSELETPAVPSTRPKPKDGGDTKSSKTPSGADTPSLPAVPATRPRKAATLDTIKTDATLELLPGTPTYQNVLDIYTQSPEQMKEGIIDNVPEDNEHGQIDKVDDGLKGTELYETTNEIESLEPVPSLPAQTNETPNVPSVDENRNSTTELAESVDSHSEETKGELSPEESSVTKEKSNSTPNEPEPPKDRDSTPSEGNQISESNLSIPDPASNPSSLEPASDSISKKSSDVTLGVLPRSSAEYHKPAVPKKPSSKIAAFQQMLAERQQQDMGMFKSRPPVPAKRPSQGAEPSEPSETGSQHTRKPLIGFSLPGVAFPGMPLPGISFTEPERDQVTDHVADVRKGRTKGPRGRKLPSRVKDSVQVNDETLGNRLNITVTTSWSIDLRKRAKSDDELQNDELQNDTLPSIDEDKNGDGSTSEAQGTEKLEGDPHENILDEEFIEVMNEDRPNLKADGLVSGTIKEPVSPPSEELGSKNDEPISDLEALAPITSNSQDVEYSLEK